MQLLNRPVTGTVYMGWISGKSGNRIFSLGKQCVFKTLQNLTHIWDKLA